MLTEPESQLESTSECGFNMWLNVVFEKACVLALFMRQETIIET